MKETKVKKWVGYVRISSDSQMENTSISEQVRQIEAFCVSQGWQLAAIFKDEGVSGSTIERDGYQEMLHYIQQPEHEVGGIVVTKSDRIHRQLNHLLDLIEEELEPQGMAFISVTERMDTSTPQGKIFLQMLGGFAEFERATINERTRNGRIATARKNQYAGGGIPYGYRLWNGNIELDKQQAITVKYIFQEYVEGTNPYRIAKLLNNAGIHTKTGKAWTVVQVQNILNNETYTGFNMYNGQKEQNGIRQKNVFPCIISRQLWNKARQIS